VSCALRDTQALLDGASVLMTLRLYEYWLRRIWAALMALLAGLLGRPYGLEDSKVIQRRLWLAGLQSLMYISLYLICWNELVV
jgi:hypothetical protein